MDAVAYQMSFDKEQLALLCANYDRCIDSLGAENKRLKSENAKLRELVRRYGEYTDQDRCEGCVCKSRCNEGEVDECWQLTEIRGLARELGIEVD